ncbi:MAG: hypothetical protein EOO92_16790 [Pedobacter sp.]|nr:MAG: hypothetical protein EOO92_16790 [Pedobacter sp.]
MKFIKITLLSIAFNLIILGFASAYYFAIPQMYFSHGSDFAKLYYRCASCTVATENAINDFAKEDYNIIMGGLETDFLFSSILLADYNIKTIQVGCMSTPEMSCYNIKIHELLFNKFGNNFLNKAYKEARQLDKSLHEK